MTIERLTPLASVEIDGVRRTLIDGSCALGTRAAFSTATVTLDPDEGRPSPGQRLVIRAGYDGATAIVFAGEIDANGVSLAPHELEVRATGLLARTNATIGEPPTVVDGETEPSYLLSWENATASTIIGDILDHYGVVDHDLEDSGKLFATLAPVGLAATDAGWSLIEQLDEVEGFRTFDGPDGTVRRMPQTGIPSENGRTFTQGVDLFAGRVDESRTGTYNRITATGLPQEGTTGVDFVPADTLSATSPWVPTPPTYRAWSYSSVLLETGDDCSEYAARKLGELNRLRGEMPFDLATGDTTLRPGMSVGIDSLVLDVRANVRFWVTEVRHDFGSGFQTSGTLLLASKGTGWSANLAPVAIIDARAKRETLANGTTIATVFLDGSASYDPELGVAGVVSYAWAVTGGGTLTSFDSAMRAVVVYSGGIPDGAYVTLTVTDALGKQGRARVYPGAAGVPLKVRDLISAELSRVQTTRDGGRTWATVQAAAADIPAVGVTEFAAAEYAFAWTAGGDLYRINADDTGELVLAGAGVTACGITLKNGDPDQATGRVWAGSSDGTVRRSLADGDSGTWVAVAPAPNGGAVKYIAESPFAEGDVEMAAGGTSYRSFDNGASWAVQYTHPNAALTAHRIASGFAKSWIGFSGPGPDAADLGASRLRERTDAVSLNFPVASRPASINGLALDPFEDTIYALDVDTGGMGRAWTGDSAAGGLLANTGAWNTALWGIPRHMARDGTAAGYLYIAATDALLKSVDGLASIVELKNLVLPAEGRMIGYGAERIPARPSGDLIWVGTTPAGFSLNRYVYKLSGSGFSRVDHPLHGVAADAGTSAASTNVALLATDTGVLITYAHTIAYRSATHTTGAYRSTDGGATWAPIGLSRVYAMATGPNGTVYAATQNTFAGAGIFAGSQLHRSDDGGATWTAVHSLGASGGTPTAYNAIRVDPTDPLRVAIKSYWTTGGGSPETNPRLIQFLVSTDGGATWVATGIEVTDALGGNGPWFAISPDSLRVLWSPTGGALAAPRYATLAPGAATNISAAPSSLNQAFASTIAGQEIYAYGMLPGAGLWVSDDQGTSWTAPSSLTDSDKVRSFVAGDESNGWYMLPNNTGATIALWQGAQGATFPATWTDLTATLLAAFPDGRYWAYNEAAQRLETA